ncbi:MAG: gamma-glutamylcyclotransferase [Bernardetiaceae bacterium]|nr:gamma-glutamylcyclotransferase [Bernardetiaceae bacterium]
MKYFAYGSNMDKDRMTEREINFSSRQFAKLDGYKLVFNKKAQGGDFTYANITPSEKDFVEGALYEFPDDEILKLDRAEGYPNHYDKIQVTVTDKNGNSINATTYIAKQDKVVEGLFPTREYLNHLLAGKDILSPSYLDKLKQVQTNESK